MNWLDVVLLFILAASIVTSFRKGLTREVIGLASVVLALVLGIEFYGSAGSLLSSYVSGLRSGQFRGLLPGVFRRAADRRRGELRDRKVLAGDGAFDCGPRAGCGFRRGAGDFDRGGPDHGDHGVFAEQPGPDSVVRSRTAPYVVDAARALAAVAPHELKEGFRKSYAEVKSIWGRALDKGIPTGPDTEKEKNERKI